MDVVDGHVHFPGSELPRWERRGFELQQQRDSEPYHTGDGHVRCPTKSIQNQRRILLLHGRYGSQRQTHHLWKEQVWCME